MNTDLKFFLAGASCTFIVRGVWVRIQGYLMIRKILKSLACEKCRGRKVIDVLVPGTTDMETYLIDCDACKGSGQKPLPIVSPEEFFE